MNALYELIGAGSNELTLQTLFGYMVVVLVLDCIASIAGTLMKGGRI